MAVRKVEGFLSSDGRFHETVEEADKRELDWRIDIVQSATKSDIADAIAVPRLYGENPSGYERNRVKLAEAIVALGELTKANMIRFADPEPDAS